MALAGVERHTPPLPMVERASRSAVLLAVGVPCGLLIAGALVGYPFTLDEPVARERLLGLAVASGLAVAAVLGLRRLECADHLLAWVAVLGGLGGVWIIAADEPGTFRGALGMPLNALFRPLSGTVHLTDPVALTNTRYIVGYNGLADLCLLVIFACGGLMLARPSRRRAVVLGAAMLISMVLVVGSGSRGGLTGLVLGVCAVALLAFRPRRALLILLGLPLVAGLVSLALIDKGLEISSTTGRVQYWSDLARLLTEYPLTGVGLGVDTANQVAVQYEINPDPERLFYAHNTFVESYLEQGPLGALGMLLVPLVAVLAVVVARRCGIVPGRRGLMLAGLGVLAGLEAHGLTDQVVTTNLGTLLTLLALAAVVAGLEPSGQRLLAIWLRRGVVVCGAALLLALVGLAALPAGRGQVLLDVGGLQMNRAFALDAQSAARAPALAQAERLLRQALVEQPNQPGVLRDLARVRWGQYDDGGALQALRQAAASPHLDAFEVLQIAHVYRDLGFADEAYAWATRAYGMWGRPAPDLVLRAYAEQTLPDDFRVRTLTDQAEAAMDGRDFRSAASLFQQALTFAPDNAYLQDRLGAAQRAASRQP